MFVENGSRRIGRLEPRDLTPGEKSFRCEVTWSDGSTSEVSQKDGAKARLGGITFLRKAYPEELKSAWSDASIAPTLLTLLLVDAQGSTPVRLLKQRLEGSIVGGPPVKEVWDKNRRAFEALESVRVTGSGATLTYSWRGRELPVWLPEEHTADWAHVFDGGWGSLPTADTGDKDVLPEETAGGGSAQQDHLNAQRATDRVAEPTPGVHSDADDQHSGGAPSKSRPRRPNVDDESEAEMVAPSPIPEGGGRVTTSSDTQIGSSAHELDPPSAVRDSSAIWKSLRSRGVEDHENDSELQELFDSSLTKLDQFLADLIFRGQDAGAERLALDAHSQLSTSIAAAPEVKRAIDSLETEARIRVERALILTDMIGAEHRSEWASSKGAPGQLGALARRIHTDSTLDRSLTARRFARAIEALTTAPQAPDDIIDAADSISALAHSHSGTIAAAISGLLTAITRSIRTGNGNQEQLKRLGLRIADLPWTEERFRMAAVIGRLDSELLGDTDWLKGITATDLVTFDLLIPPLLNNARWQDSLRATAESAVRAVGSRRQLLLLLSSTTVASLVSADIAIAALRRTAGADPALREWLAGLAQTDAIEALGAEVAREAAAAIAARELVRQRDGQVQELASRLADAQGRLALAADSYSTTRESTLAQAERDAYRLLASALSTVETAVDRLDPESLLIKLHQQVRRRGIEPIGQRGESVAFDPSLHEAPGGRPDAGSPVVVGRSGYLWVRGDQREVLIKALVTGEQP